MPIVRNIVRLWLRRYRKGTARSGIRAVFLGDGVSHAVILKGQYEPFELEVLEREVFPDLPARAMAFDVGANIGNHTEFFARHFDRVTAFEPNPQVRLLLEANVMGRPVDVVPAGLSDREGEMGFALNWANLGASRIVEEGGDIRVAVRTLDDVAAEAGIAGVDFVKIDAEGHEAQVIAGGRETLRAHGPLVALEAHFASAPDRAGAVLAALTDCGYTQFYQLVPRHPLVRDLVRRGLRADRGPLALLLPERMRRTMTVVPAPDPKGRDHDLLFAARGPMPFGAPTPEDG